MYIVFYWSLLFYFKNYCEYRASDKSSPALNISIVILCACLNNRPNNIVNFMYL